MTLADRIRATFTTCQITYEFDQTMNHEVQGITVRDLKDRLRGVVYQSQSKFVNQIRSSGFDMTWSMKYNAYVVHDQQ